MTQYLPPNLLALFAPREPIPYLPPVGKLPHERRRVPYSGISQYLEFFDTKEVEPVIPKKIETRQERRDRRRKEKAEQVAYIIEQGIALWNPHNPSHKTHDAYKTLFIGRINYDTSESKLKKEFSEFGSIKKLYAIYNKVDGKPRGYAFIEYEHERDMHAAYKRGDGRKIDGRRVLVDVERGRTIKGWLPRRFGGGLGNTRKTTEPNMGGASTQSRAGSRDRDRERKRSTSRRRRRSRTKSKSRERDSRKHRRRSPTPIKREPQPSLLTAADIKREKMENGKLSPSEFMDTAAALLKESTKKIKKEKRSKRSRSKERGRSKDRAVKREKKDKRRDEDKGILDTSHIKKEKEASGLANNLDNSNNQPEFDSLERYYYNATSETSTTTNSVTMNNNINNGAFNPPNFMMGPPPGLMPPGPLGFNMVMPNNLGVPPPFGAYPPPPPNMPPPPVNSGFGVNNTQQQ